MPRSGRHWRTQTEYQPIFADLASQAIAADLNPRPTCQGEQEQTGPLQRCLRPLQLLLELRRRGVGEGQRRWQQQGLGTQAGGGRNGIGRTWRAREGRRSMATRHFSYPSLCSSDPPTPFVAILSLPRPLICRPIDQTTVLRCIPPPTAPCQFSSPSSPCPLDQFLVFSLIAFLILPGSPCNLSFLILRQ